MRVSSLVAAGLIALATAVAHANSSLEFFGYNGDDVDRLRVPLVVPMAGGGMQSTPVNVGGDFTIEFWMKAVTGPNQGVVYDGASGDGWITGNIIVDRDVYFAGDFGDFGIALGRPNGDSSRRVLAFGLFQQGTGGRTLVGETNLATNTWRHVAVTRRSSDGRMAIYIDGQLDADVISGVTGDLSYNPDRPTAYPASDPFLVIGTEKHDADPAIYPSYAGLLDELRISDVVRYASNFTPSAQPFATDSATRLLLHLDEGGPHGPAGNYAVTDASGLNGVTRHVGGTPTGPLYVNDTPFAANPIAGDYNGNSTVDAADYSVWRDGLGGTYSPGDYDVWKSQFGQMAPGVGSGSGDIGPSQAVPEPSTIFYWACAVLAAFVARRARSTTSLLGEAALRR